MRGLFEMNLKWLRLSIGFLQTYKHFHQKDYNDSFKSAFRTRWKWKFLTLTLIIMCMIAVWSSLAIFKLSKNLFWNNLIWLLILRSLIKFVVLKNNHLNFKILIIDTAAHNISFVMTCCKKSMIILCRDFHL